MGIGIPVLLGGAFVALVGFFGFHNIPFTVSGSVFAFIGGFIVSKGG